MKKFLTQKELEYALEQVVDELENERREFIHLFLHFLYNINLIIFLEVDAVYIPPDVDELTDEEDIDDDLSNLNETAFENVDIAGTFELHINDDDLFDDSDDETLAEKKRKLSNSKSCALKPPEWKKGNISLKSQPLANEDREVEQIRNQLEGKSPLDLFFMFFDTELLDAIVGYSLKYAQDNNRHDFDFDRTDLLKFIGILILSGYHTLPQTQLYWSSDEDKGLQIVKNCMSRNTFQNIKRNIHLSDNSKLDKNDKFTKLRPFFDLVNKRNLQFGLFTFNLSIDEQMVPYFGRHSCKMYIKGKPVRFGFKLWCLCSSDGYLYKFVPYAGASKEKSTVGLGGQVVLDLLSIVEKPENHQIFFDNFFSSYKLFTVLSEKGFYATGTIRENRTNNCPLESTKSIAKKERGTYDTVYDEGTRISLVRWNDNSVVTAISNQFNSDPLSFTKRYSRKEKKEINVDQPNIIKMYNRHMGGVDLHDNGIANYRIGVNGKKWWWPLFVNTIDSVIVNAWRLYNRVNTKTIGQLEFKSYIALRLMKMHNNRAKPSSSRVPSELRLDNIGHVITKADNKARRRCKICHNHTIFLCKRCNVHLHTDCFEQYHTK